MRPFGRWSEGRSYGAVVSSDPRDSAYPGGADEGTIAAYGGHLIAESICSEHRKTISALPELITALEVIRDADNDCGKDGLPHNLPRHIRQLVDEALTKAGVS